MNNILFWENKEPDFVNELGDYNSEEELIVRKELGL